MARASPAALDRIDDVLAAVRAQDGVTEKSRGVFYRRRDAFLHFHEEGAAVLADLKETRGGGFTRFDVTSGVGRRAFLDALKTAVW
jgi:hypothetical protein